MYASTLSSAAVLCYCSICHSRVAGVLFIALIIIIVKES